MTNAIVFKKQIMQHEQTKTYEPNDELGTSVNI